MQITNLNIFAFKVLERLLSLVYLSTLEKSNLFHQNLKSQIDLTLS